MITATHAKRTHDQRQRPDEMRQIGVMEPLCDSLSGPHADRRHPIVLSHEQIGEFTAIGDLRQQSDRLLANVAVVMIGEHAEHGGAGRLLASDGLHLLGVNVVKRVMVVVGHLAPQVAQLKYNARRGGESNS